MKKYYKCVFLILILITMILFSDQGIEAMKSIINRNSERTGTTVVVIDPGHGGRDPGKVGVNNSLEKDINLAIALKLRDFLIQNEIQVIMTRIDDTGLYDSTDSNKKAADLRKRVEIIEESDAILAVSIHQNSFSESRYKGAQVFYHEKSTQGKMLANIIQERIKATVKDDNKREAKANDSYYMLKKTTCPLVIVECGFLSNQAEAMLLCDDAYQEKMAWAIHLGILQQLKSTNATVEDQ